MSRDTQTVSTLLRVGNNEYTLSLSCFSLNDSAVVNVTPPSAIGEQAGRHRVFHNKAWRIHFDYEGYVLDTILTKQAFESVLPDSVIHRSVLLYCENCSVRSNTLYFQALIGSPLMNDSRFVRFNVYFRGPKRGAIYGLIVDPNGRYCRRGLQ
jgi:hypothetical protein